MSYVITDNHGRPVAVASNRIDAQIFAYRHSGGKIAPGSGMEWSRTGKLIIGGRWTGWEVREVREVGTTTSH